MSSITIITADNAPYVPKWVSRYDNFKSNFVKLCPKCGALVALNAKGCDNCLFQFNNNNNKGYLSNGK